MKNIHLIMPFSRHHLWDTLLSRYWPMKVILHPLTFAGERVPECASDWIMPFVADMKEKNLVALINAFLDNYPIADEDYYVVAPDDDMYETGVFDAIREMDDPVIIISMKRGHRIPEGVSQDKAYPPTTLYAEPKYMVAGSVGGEQVILKGSVLKKIRWDESGPIADGLMVEYLKENYPIKYRPDLFCLFNYFEPDRWDKVKVAFGVLVNDMMRLDMVFRQSVLNAYTAHTIKLPESACKGLNKLLGIMEAEGDEIGVLTHQDMFYRAGWVDRMKEQIEKLPKSWIIAGIIGKDMKGGICGRYHDMRIPLHFATNHEYPQPASCFDECCIIVNLKKGFRFDERMPGFDLYGTLAVLQAKEMGGTAWIIDAFAEHYTMRSFEWYPDAAFSNCFKWIHRRFPDADRIDSTVIATEKEDKAA